MYRYFAVALIAVCLLPLAQAQPESRPYTVVATTGMVGDLVGAVAGDHANVTTLIQAGVDPHLYRPTRNDVTQLLGADVIFYNGLLLEGKMTDTFVRVARRRPVYAVTELVEKSALIQPEGAEGHFDPHVWMDVRAWMKATDAVANALAEFDPPQAATYRKNAAEFRARLARLDAYVREITKTIPKAQRLLITAHDAFGYFGKAYDIEVQGVQGLSTESEAGLKRINELVALIADRKVPAVFVETSVADKNVKALIEGARSKGHTVRIGGALFSDAMGPANSYEGTYIGMLDHNATTITRALGGKAPAGGMQGKLSNPEKD